MILIRVSSSGIDVGEELFIVLFFKFCHLRSEIHDGVIENA